MDRLRREILQNFIQNLTKSFCDLPFPVGGDCWFRFLCDYKTLSVRSTGDVREIYGRSFTNISRSSNALYIDVSHVLREMLG